MRRIVLLVVVALVVPAVLASPAWAAEITVDNTADELNTDGDCSLREAIEAANTDAAVDGCVAGSGADTITFDVPDPSTISLTGGELPIAGDLEISGPGATALTISGNDTSRVFFVNPGAPGATSGPPATSLSVDISDLTIANGLAKGGNGGAASGPGGGGGAAGMGGAIFVNNGSVTISGVAFSDNRAQGGNGGACCDGFLGGGGGGGVGANGAGGGFAGGAGGGGGSFGGNGGAGGADGGLLPEGSPGGNGGPGGDGAGGGGGGIGHDCPEDDFGGCIGPGANGGAGGDGGFGGGSGGGGASGFDQSGSAIGGDGGTSGFGGGGGGGGGSQAGSLASEGGAGGAGGSFGGAGAGGDGGSGGAGGGGAGLGGAIFIRAGSLTLADSTFTDNAASGGTGANNGQGKGGALFVLSPASVSGCATFSGNSATDAAGSGTDTNDTYGVSVPACDTTPTVAVDRGGSCGSASDMRGTINLSLIDPDDAPEDLTLSATSSDPGVVPDAKVVFGGGTDASRTLTVTSLTGRGASTLRVTVSDGDLEGLVKVKVRSGNAADNTLTGSPDTDMIFARRGSDTASGRGAIDLLCGGNGKDRLRGGPGADRFGGGQGIDAALDFDAGEGDTKAGIP